VVKGRRGLVGAHIQAILHFIQGLPKNTNVCNLCVRVDRFCGRRFNVKLKNSVWFLTIECRCLVLLLLSIASLWGSQIFNYPNLLFCTTLSLSNFYNAEIDLVKIVLILDPKLHT
jgi:hypothetical protein